MRWLVRPKDQYGYVYQFVVVWPGDVLGLLDSTVGVLTFGFVRSNLSMRWMFKMALKHSRWVRKRLEVANV